MIRKGPSNMLIELKELGLNLNTLLRRRRNLAVKVRIY